MLKSFVLSRGVGAFALAGLAVACGSSHDDSNSSLDDALVQGPGGCGVVQIDALENGLQRGGAWGVQPKLQGVLTDDQGNSLGTVSLHLRQGTEPWTAAPKGAQVVGSTGADFSSCTNCVLAWYNGVPYVAESGTLSFSGFTNREQLAGSLEKVTLRQVEFDKSISAVNASRIVPGGGCLYVAKRDFDTRIEGGCDPLQTSTACGAGKTCEALNVGATDGICVKSAGSIADGAACEADLNGDSGCAVGSVCANQDSAGRGVCAKRCNLQQSATGCTGGTICSGYGVCQQPANVTGGPLLAAIKVGDTCSDAQYGQACGADGNLGVCVDVDGQSGAEKPVCAPISSLRGACLASGATRELGYVNYAGDQSLGFCYKRLAYQY